MARICCGIVTFISSSQAGGREEAKARKEDLREAAEGEAGLDGEDEGDTEPSK